MESDWTQTVFAQDVAEVSAYVIWINKIPHIVYTDVLQIFFTIASPALLALLFLTGFRCNQCGFNLWYQRQCAEAGIVLCPFFGYIYRLSVHINTLECVRNGDSFIHKVDGRPLQPQQLRKIGSGDTVYGAVYQAIHHNAQWTIDHDSSGNLIMLYGGDADLTKGQNGTDDYTLGKDGIHEADKKFSDKANNLLYVYTVGRCGVNQKTGEIDPNLDIDKAANQTYAANANYIIFRDIDLSTKEWTPLTFQGTMIGAKSANGEKIWNDDSSAINTSTKPTISNISVMQTGKLNVGEQMGVGFFSTISSEVSEKDIGLSKGLVQVSNLKFQNISVQTTTSETYYPETLVSELTSTLGKLLGGVLSGLTFILTFGQVKIDLGKTLGNVLDARKKDPTALATGAIAGRVEGQVLFSGIEVVKANVKNVNNNTGGFVGYTVGVTQYDGLSNALGGLVKLLSNILNVIPGLGLGDLITILLGNAIPLGKLIPTGYINAKFVDCSIDGLNISTSIEKDYADLLVAGSAKFTARSKVRVFFKIRKNVCVVGAGAGLLRQQAQNQAVIQRRQVGSWDRKRGGRLHALL